MSVRVERDRAVAVVTLDRPEARNALTGELISRLRSAFAELDADTDVRAVVLTGADPAFCAGLDLKEAAGSGDNLSVVDDVAGPYAPISKPVIAAVNGAAYTGGLELALSCDIRLASDRAVFADTHARVGLMPGWGLTVRLPRAIGYARALEMSFSGTRLDAARALAWGLVNHVVPHAELLDVAKDMARQIATLDPVVVGKLLSMYRDSDERPPAQALHLESRISAEWIAAMDRTTVPSPAALSGGGPGISGG
jgi:enoyl-CoA hydratase